MNITPFNVFLVILAIWRLSSLFANEDGPFDIFKRLRLKAKHLTQNVKLFNEFKLHEGLGCEWCNSIWFGTIITLFWIVFGDIVVTVLLPLSMSTAVISIKYVIHVLEKHS